MNMVHVPSRDSASDRDVMAGHVDMMFIACKSGMPTRGRWNLLGVDRREWLPRGARPPNAREAGVPGYGATASFSFLGTDRTLQGRHRHVLQQALKETVQKRTRCDERSKAIQRNRNFPADGQSGGFREFIKSRSRFGSV